MRPPLARVEAGDTFFVHGYNHLYVVCSDPACDSEHILIVNITTFKPKEEDCCIIHKDEHPFLKHRSCMRYKDARVVSLETITTLLNGGQMAQKEPVSDELLERIRKGAHLSDYLPEEHRRLLQRQALIPEP